MTEAVFRERLQAIIDWADLAMKNREEFDSHGVRNLDGPVFDAAREALSKYPPAQTNLAGIDLPADIIESLLAIGPVEWGQTFCQSDEKHVDDFRDTLRITREHFGIADEATGIHGVYLEGTGTVLAHTGMSPNSPQHARILVGAWNQLVEIAKTHALTMEGQPPSPSPNVVPVPALWAECAYCKEAGEEECLHPVNELRWNGEQWCCEECGSGEEPDLWQSSPQIVIPAPQTKAEG